MQIKTTKPFNEISSLIYAFIIIAVAYTVTYKVKHLAEASIKQLKGSHGKCAILKTRGRRGS